MAAEHLDNLKEDLKETLRLSVLAGVSAMRLGVTVAETSFLIIEQVPGFKLAERLNLRLWEIGDRALHKVCEVADNIILGPNEEVYSSSSTRPGQSGENDEQ